MATHTLLLLLTGKVAIGTIIHTLVVMEEVVVGTLLTQAIPIALFTMSWTAMALCLGGVVALWTV